MERIANYGGCIVGKSQFFLAEISATAVVPINEISGRMIGNTAGKLVFAGSVKNGLGFRFAGWGWAFIAFFAWSRCAYVGRPAYIEVSV